MSNKQFLDAWEWLEHLRATGDNATADFASELLELKRLEDVESEHLELVESLGYYHPDEKPPAPDKLAEWLGDRSQLLDEVRDILTDNGVAPDKDIDDAIREELALLNDVRDMLEEKQLWDRGCSLVETIAELCENQKWDL